MKKLFLLTMVFAWLGLAAQTGPFYVAARTGLSIRDKADVNGKVIDKIPYGAKITLIEENQVVIFYGSGL